MSQCNQPHSCTGPSQRHSCRLRFYSRMFLRSLSPSGPHHRLQQKRRSKSSGASFAGRSDRRCDILSPEVCRNNSSFPVTFPAVVSGPAGSAGTPSTHRVTSSVVLTHTLHLTSLTETSTRARCARIKRKKCMKAQQVPVTVFSFMSQSARGCFTWSGICFPS